MKKNKLLCLTVILLATGYFFAPAPSAYGQILEERKAGLIGIMVFLSMASISLCLFHPALRKKP